MCVLVCITTTMNNTFNCTASYAESFLKNAHVFLCSRQACTFSKLKNNLFPTDSSASPMMKTVMLYKSISLKFTYPPGLLFLLKEII